MTANKNHSAPNKNQEEIDEYSSEELRKLGEFISKLRRANGLKQSDAWKTVASSESVYARMEQGKRDLRYSEIYKIAKLHGISVADFFKLQEQDVVLMNSNNNIGDNNSNVYANITGQVNIDQAAITHLQQSFSLLHRQLEETQRRLEALEKEQKQ